MHKYSTNVNLHKAVIQDSRDFKFHINISTSFELLYNCGAAWLLSTETGITLANAWERDSGEKALFSQTYLMEYFQLKM